MKNRGGTESGWGPAAASIAVVLLLVLFLYSETTSYLFTTWDGEYAHGYLVLLISLYLVFRKRRTLAGLQPCPSVPALLAVMLASLLWLSAKVVDVQMAQSVSLLVLILAITWAVLGAQVMRYLMFPILFLVFAIPVWSLLSPALQALTADAAFWLTRVAGVPALREGHQVILPAGQFSIEEACSGLRYLLAGLTLGVLYAYLNYRRLWVRILVISIAAVAAIVANVLRVFIVIYLGHETEMQHPWVKDHLYLGWYLFGGVVFLLMLTDVWIHRRTATDPAAVEAPAGQPVAAESCRYRFPYRMFVLAIAAVLAAAGPAFSSWLDNRVVAGPDGRLVFPEIVGIWHLQEDADDDWKPFYPGAMPGLRTYRHDGNALFVFLGFYPVQSQGREVINDLNRIAGKTVWKAAYARGRTGKSTGLPVLEQRLKTDSGRQRLVWYWYEVAGRHTTNRYAAKLYQVAGLLTGQPHASVYAVATDISGDIENARQRLDSFVSTTRFPVFEPVKGDG